jgi:NodT family efflux transporter outer membrane factor (OMF) lipoprotein
MKNICLKYSLMFCCLLILSNCAIGPNYVRPETPLPQSYKELGSWKIAEPRYARSDLSWWTIFNDPILNDLEEQVNVSNQSIKASESAYEQAQYAIKVAQSAFFPIISINASDTISRNYLSTSSSSVTGKHSFSLAPTASWTPDIWGKLRRQLEIAQAQASLSSADLAAVRLSCQTALASDYFSLRATDELIALLEQTVAAYTQSLRITQNQYRQGIVSKSDVAQAINQLETTRAQFVNAGIQRAQLEHALATLIGKTPENFSLSKGQTLSDPPEIPLFVPSTLLERRPDIAAAEDNIIIANAQIGVQLSAFFPELSIGGSFSFDSKTFNSILKAPNPVWSFGPSLAQSVFNPALIPQTLSAQSYYDQQVATYRQTVLSAIQSVDDLLVSLQIQVKQLEIENKAVEAAKEAERLILNQYKAGTIAYTSVVTAQSASLTAQQTALNIRQSLLINSVTLIQNLGGGWDKQSSKD